MSVNSGTLYNSRFSSHNSDDANIGNAAFFEPLTLIEPNKLALPVIIILSIFNFYTFFSFGNI